MMESALPGGPQPTRVIEMIRIVEYGVSPLPALIDFCECGNTFVQHGELTCAELAAVKERVQYTKLSRLGRMLVARPEGWPR